jgi:hypothetical protein
MDQIFLILLCITFITAAAIFLRIWVSVNIFFLESSRRLRENGLNGRGNHIEKAPEIGDVTGRPQTPQFLLVRNFASICSITIGNHNGTINKKGSAIH